MVVAVSVLASLSVPAPSSAAPPTVTRSGGPDRASTAVAISTTAWPDGAKTALVARSDTHPDALAAAPLAAALDAPLLLTRPDALEPVVADELRRLGVDEVVLLGGPAAISERVAQQAAALGTRVRRIAGADRYATAQMIADALAETTGAAAATAYVARGSGERGWADALSVAPLAGRQRIPLLLADHQLLPYSSIWLSHLKGFTLVGGEAVLDTDLGAALRVDRSRLSGSDRYATSLRVADAALADLRANKRLDSGLQVWLATGTTFPDALAAGPAVANRNAVLLLAPPRWQGSATRTWIVEHADEITEVRLLGSSKALPDAVAADLARGPGGQAAHAIIDASFDGAAVGPMAGDTWRAADGFRWVNGDRYDNLSIVEEDGQKFVRALIPKGRYQKGMMREIRLPSEHQTDELYLEYDLRWSSPQAPSTAEGTREMFGKGGKLPGFYGGRLIDASGGHRPNGDEFSMRMMWYGPSAYRHMSPGQMSYYAYTMDGKQKVGKWDTAFQRDRWVTIRQHVKLNTVGEADGIVRAWVDDQQVWDQHGVRFRDTSVPIQGIAMHAWRGGNDGSWTSKYDAYVDLRNFRVWRP